MLTAVDIFAGAGGFTEGARMAGVRVIWAANHWQLAVDTHAANHLEAMHVCQDLRQADFTAIPSHDMLLASPCCQGHSHARGKDGPQHDASRSTAFAVIECLDARRSSDRPYAVVVENVPAFIDWVLWPSWRDALERLGYAVGTHIIDAADCGVPQHRERLFIVATRSTWPLQIGYPSSARAPVSSILDLEAGKWRPVDSPARAPKTLARVAAGRARFGPRFVMPYYKSGSGLTGRSLERPLGTVTTRDRWAIVDGDRMRMLSIAEYRRAMGFPDGYVLPPQKAKALHLLGNACVPPQVAWVLERVKEAA